MESGIRSLSAYAYHTIGRGIPEHIVCLFAHGNPHVWHRPPSFLPTRLINFLFRIAIWNCNKYIILAVVLALLAPAALSVHNVYFVHYLFAVPSTNADVQSS